MQHYVSIQPFRTPYLLRVQDDIRLETTSYGTVNMQFLHVSNPDGKLKDIRAIGTNTLNNTFCHKMHNMQDDKIICTKCYSWAMLQGFRKNVASALQRNTDILSKTILSFNDVEVIKDDVFRFQHHGELINMKHFKNFVNIARKNPDCTFALWTKRKDIVAKYYKAWSARPKERIGIKLINVRKWHKDLRIPPNLILVYSNPRIDKVMMEPPKHFHKVFNNVTPDNHTVKHNCTGQKCRSCLLCYSKSSGCNTIIEGVKNRG